MPGPSADTAPAPRAWSVASKVAILMGLVIVASSAPGPSDVATQAFTAPHVAGATSSTAAGAWAPRTPQPGTPMAPALAARPREAPTVATPAPTQPNVMRGVGWATLWVGTMTAIGTLLWNRMSRLNQEVLDEEAAGGAPWDPRAGLAAVSATALAMAFQPAPAFAEIRLPALDSDPNRCERAFVGNTIGQANAVSGKPLDLRQCDLKEQNFKGRTLSGALMVDGQFQGSSFVEAVLSKVYAAGANFQGADFTSAVLDRAVFDKADMSGVKFYNTVITASSFVGTNLAGTEFEGSLIGSEDAKRLCANPTLTGESRYGVGCRD